MGKFEAISSLENIIEENKKLQKDYESIMKQNEELRAAITEIENRIEPLLIFEPLVKDLPKHLTVTLRDAEIIKTLLAIVATSWGRSPKEAPKIVSTDTEERKRAAKDIDAVLSSMVSFIGKSRVRIVEFLKEEKLLI